jgi:hypothetical protein
MAIYSISGIGRASKAQRMARRTARRKAGKGFGQKLKKGLRGVLKVAASPARNAFLGLVQLNVRNLAKKLDVAYQKNPTSLKNFWEKFGGRIDKLLGAINRGKKKKRILGVGEESIFDAMPYAIGSVTTLMASAAPILAAVSKFLKSVGIQPQDLTDFAKRAVSIKAKELLNNQLVPEARQEEEFQESTENETE